MKKIYLATALLLFISLSFVQAQNETIINDLKSDKVSIETYYADLIIHAWDKNYIKMEALAEINGVDSYDRLNLEVENRSNSVKIESDLDLEGIPEAIIIRDPKGKTTYHKKGSITLNGLENYSTGFQTDAVLEIWVPKNFNVDVDAVYGYVKIEGEFDDLKIFTTYGKVDASLPNAKQDDIINLESTYGFVDLTINDDINSDIKLNTTYGEVYSDLDLIPGNNQSRSKNKYHCGGDGAGTYKINAGGNVPINLSAKYANIYVRKHK